MDVAVILEIIGSFGFPIACVIAMAWFVYTIYKRSTNDNQKHMETVQQRCKEREERLYEEIKENRTVNAKAIETIAHYAEKLDVIQKDINEIKTEITVIATKQD